MAIALVAGQHASASFSVSASSIAVSFPAGTGAGNLICELSMCNSAQSPTLPTDDKTNTYAVSAPQTVSTNQKVTGYYAKNVVGGTVQVTAHFSAATSFGGVGIAEFSGADTGAPLDQVGGQATAATADALSPSKTPTQSNELIWGGCVNNIGASNTSGTVFTLLDTDAGSGHATEYFVQGSAAAIQTEFKAGASGDWAVLIATFFAAAAGPPPVSPQSGEWALNFQAVGPLDETISPQPADSTGPKVRTLETVRMLPGATATRGGAGTPTAAESQVVIVSDPTGGVHGVDPTVKDRLLTLLHRVGDWLEEHFYP